MPEPWRDSVRVGSVVRVELHGRRVGGWVVATDVEPDPALSLRPLAKVSGWGPPPGLIELATWAAWRWAGRRASFLGTASPPRVVAGVPPAASRPAPPDDEDAAFGAAFDAGKAVVRLAPAGDRYPWVLAAARRGLASGGEGSGVLVLCPSVESAGRLAARLRRSGLPTALLPQDWAAARAGGCVVVGARAAAWAPLERVALAVVLDAHDEAYQGEASPTWNAWVVVAERAARDGGPCVLLSPCPTLEQLDWGTLVTTARSDERAGWATFVVADRRGDDPRTGLYSPSLVDVLRSGQRVLVVLNRKGRARLLACASCASIVVCERCTAVVTQDDDGLRCLRCAAVRPTVCLECRATKLKVLRAGVTRVRDDLEALAGVPVGEVTGETETVPAAGILVGTEALLHRVPRADVVAFLEFDQELLASRYRAAEQALGLLARASRAVGGRAGRVLVQTRMPGHEVLAAAIHADPELASGPERQRRRDLGMPPFAALAAVSGEAAAAYVDQVRAPVEALGPDDGRWLLRAAEHAALCDGLAAITRPPGRLRVEVDPLRI